MIDHPKPSLTRYIAPAIITAFILIAIVIGLAPRGPKGNFIQSSEFQLAMDRAPMGQSQPLPGRMTTIPIQSFRDRRNRYCRVFSLTGAIIGSGVVCRQNGEWQLEGRADAEDRERRLHATMQRLGGAGSIDAATERRAIADNWRT